ncbi:hypothetical protein FQR65_LT18360 [Abscondita terminalis]|nr:hypothetical protein FQR65_LT18360 [Abscondita terminalis]
MSKWENDIFKITNLISAHVTDVARVNVDVGNNTQGSTTLTSSKSSITSDAESISRIIVTEQQLEEKVSNYLASLKSNPPINVDTGEDDLALHNNQPISNENIRFDQEYTSNTPKNNQEYIRKPSARERPTICPICFKDVITHFPRHLFRHHKEHKDVILLRSLKPKSKERVALIASLRKQGYFHLKNEKNVLNPVRNSNNTNVQHFVCTTDIKGLFDALKPEYFNLFILATKNISGYDITMKTFKSPSLALHMGTNLKMVCDVAFKIVIEKKQIPNIKWINKSEKKTEIKELRKLIDNHWCSELSSLALKDMKEKQWNNPIQLPLTSDIKILNNYLNTSADDAFNDLNGIKQNIRKNYKILTECVLALTVMFNRKRIGDVQYLKIESYTTPSKRTTDQEDFINSLTSVEKILCTKFKRVITGGKGSKPVPILFSNKLQKFVNCLIAIRKNTDVVPKSNPYLFANPGSINRWMSGTNVIRKYAFNSGAKNPNLLTTTKFRKHIATTLQLMCMDDTEMEQIATFMGHTKKTHQEFYRLPQDIFQMAKVAKVLLLLEKGMGEKFKGKSINDIHLERDIYYSSESDPEADDNMPLSERVLERVATSFNVNVQDNRNENDEDGLNKATTSEELADVDSLFYKETEMNSLSLEDEEGEKENPNYPLSTEIKSKTIEKKLIRN